jgi:lipopolysaccharide export system protein LptA
LKHAAFRLVAAGLVLGALMAACAKPALSPRAQSVDAPLPALPAPTPTQTPAPQYPQARPIDEKLPVKIKSRSLKVAQGGAETVFYGGVTVTQDSTVLNASELKSRDQGASALAQGGVKLTDPVRKVQALADEVEYGDALRQATLRGNVRLLSVDPYGVSVTLTGQSATYLALSREAAAGGGVHIYRGSLTATADSALMLSGGATVRMKDGVDARLGPNRARADKADLEASDRSLHLQGHVRARFIPSEIRKAAAEPAGVR